MRKIELELEGIAVTARLLDDKAPKTCQALWEILPFEDMVTHSRWSGGRLHTHHHPELHVDASHYPYIENPCSFQAPGDVVVMPLNNEIAIPYASGGFQWMGQQWVVTRVAVIEGDMSSFARKIERLQWEGAKRLIIRRAIEKEEPSQEGVGRRARVEIECEGKRWVLELLENKAPKLCRAILDALPLEGPITNMHSSGEVLHFWAAITRFPSEPESKPERWPVDFQGNQIGSTGVAFYDPFDVRGTNPGDILFHSVEGLRVVHGQVQMDQTHFSRRGPLVGYGWTQKVGRIVEGDLRDLSAIADRVEWEGAKTMRMKRLP